MGYFFMHAVYRRIYGHLWAISLCTPLIGELTDIYRLYSLCTPSMGKLADIYRLCFSCTLSIGELTDIYRLCLSTSSISKLIDIYGLYVLYTPFMGKLADIYGIIFLFLVKRLRSIDVISELQEYFLFPNFIKVYLPATKPAQQKM